jgi:ribonucleoside-diphosphate reductase alpha chain
MDKDIHRIATKAWDDVVKLGEKNGYRNAQASVLAPTGTIGFMMDCDTTGIEPDFSLVKFKKLVGGGSMQIVNLTIPRALRKLGYTEETVEAIVEYIADKGHVIDAPGPEDRALRGVRHRDGCARHLPDGPRADDGGGAAVPVRVPSPRRSTCRRRPPSRRSRRSTSRAGSWASRRWPSTATTARWASRCPMVARPPRTPRPTRPGLPSRRRRPRSWRRSSTGRRVSACPSDAPRRPSRSPVGGAEGYLTAGTYDDGRLGELFLKFGKQGSTLAGVMDAFSIVTSVALQYGVPLETFVEKFTNMRFEPAGMTDDPDVRMAQSLMDYVFRRLALDYLDFDTRSYMGIHTAEERARQLETGSYAPVDEETGEDLEEELESFSQGIGASSKKSDAVAPVASSAAAKPSGSGAAEGKSLDASAVSSGAGAASAREVSSEIHSSADLLAAFGDSKAADAPMCMTCGTKMRPAGSCYVCEGCGSTSGCS